MKINIEINPKYQGIVGPLAEELAANGIPPSAKCIHSARNRLYKLKYAGLNLNIKAFKVPAFPNSYIYTNFRKSKAFRSFIYATELLKRGLPTPEPVAAIEVCSNNRLMESYYVSIHSHYANDLRYWEKRNEKERDDILHAYARLMVAMHRAGVQHHDLSPGNVMWHRKPGEKTINFHIVDLNRMTLRKRPLKKSEAFSNFRNINLIEDETRRLGHIYGKEAGIHPAEAENKAVDALRNDLKRKKFFKTLKSVFKRRK